jgi:hypothetical protein
VNVRAFFWQVPAARRPDESVALVYLDPPINSNRSYNVLFRDDNGKAGKIEIGPKALRREVPLRGPRPFAPLGVASPQPPYRGRNDDSGARPANPQRRR